jgi:hypothetical protein
MPQAGKNKTQQNIAVPNIARMDGSSGKGRHDSREVFRIRANSALKRAWLVTIHTNTDA